MENGYQYSDYLSLQSIKQIVKGTPIGVPFAFTETDDVIQHINQKIAYANF